MRYLVVKDKKQRVLYKKLEKKRNLIKCLVRNKFLDIFFQKRLKTLFLNVKGYKSKIKNYCLITNRSRGILRKYNVSRMIFKQCASFGYLRGVRKASW